MEDRLLTCPIRGQLSAAMLARDGLTVTEEARRIDLLHFLLRKGYPRENIATETVVIKNLGESGRNKVRADVTVYEIPAIKVKSLDEDAALAKAVLVAEVKRDSSRRQSAVANQLKPALIQLPGLHVMGVYWDDASRLLFTKELVTRGSADFVEISEHTLEHLPTWGRKYKSAPIRRQDLSPPDNLVSTLYAVANVMRSHGINDEHLRYKETVKLILARYCDERAAASSSSELSLQVLPGDDPDFATRVDALYQISAKRYKQAKTLFYPVRGTELSERTLREVVKLVQGIAFTQAGNDIMQQVFLSFVPAVFKKNLDQFFTPLTLVETMVDFVQIGPNDKVVDPAMGTGDFLTAAMECRRRLGDSDAYQRVYGADIDPKAYDLAVINMILNKDGQSNLHQEDSIENYERWTEEMDVALCNPPFGERSIETRQDILSHYELGQEWAFDHNTRHWRRTKSILPSQQLGILFIEKCYKMLANKGRMAIILPEGYLCTASYGYVREWLLSHFRIVALIELPRRIFLKSNADLRSNIVIAQKLEPHELSELQRGDYPIYTGLVRKVGYKLGAGFAPVQKADPETGEGLRDENNKVILDSDFTDIRKTFGTFTRVHNWISAPSQQQSKPHIFDGGAFSDVQKHDMLDLKARRLMPNAIGNRRNLLRGGHVRLDEIATVVDETLDLRKEERKVWRLVEGSDIRANEGVVVPQHPARFWEIINKKGRTAYHLSFLDIIIGLVRPERRNIGLLLHSGGDMISTPDGTAVVRLKETYRSKYTQEWLFAQLRTEKARLQLWTESGGTSYGKLTADHIKSLIIPIPDAGEIESVSKAVKHWSASFAQAFTSWEQIGASEDRRPILNSAIIGLEHYEDEET